MYDVILIGAGITGCYCAHYLTQEGLKVCLIDNKGIASQASLANPGGLNPLHGPQIPGKLSDFSLASFQLHLNSRETLRADQSPKIISRLFVAFTLLQLDKLKQQEKLYNSVPGFSAQWLNHEDISTLNIGLSPDIKAGLMTDGNATVDSRIYAQAVFEYAKANGAHYINEQLQSITTDSNAITSIQCRSINISANAYVFTTGPWMPEFKKVFGVEYPLIPLKGELLRIKSEQQLNYDISCGLKAIYQQNDGTYIIGGTESNSGFDRRTTDSGRESIITGIKKLFPSFSDYQVLEHMAGLRPKTKDDLPIIGASREINNAWLATGGGSKGMLLSTGMAKAITELIMQSDSTINISSFSPYRYTT